MEKGDSDHIKLRLAATFRSILNENKVTSKDNKTKGVEDLRLVDNMRQLESSSGLSFTIIQTTLGGKRDIQFTTLLTLIDTLRISFSEFANLYEAVTDEDIKKAVQEIEANKKIKVANGKNKRK